MRSSGQKTGGNVVLSGVGERSGGDMWIQMECDEEQDVDVEQRNRSRMVDEKQWIEDWTLVGMWCLVESVKEKWTKYVEPDGE